MSRGQRREVLPAVLHSCQDVLLAGKLCTGLQLQLEQQLRMLIKDLLVHSSSCCDDLRARMPQAGGL